RVPAFGLVLQHLDDLIAVSRLLGDQRKREQAKVALRQHAAGAHHVVAALAAHAVTPAAKAVPMVAAPPAVKFGGSAVLGTRMSHSKHLKFLPLVLRYIFR